jgi:hypothetical protein
VTIASGDGQPIALEGNGLTLTANGAIDTANAAIGFRWTNWCGSPGPSILRATLAGDTATSPIEQPSSCDDPGMPSRLGWR